MELGFLGLANEFEDIFTGNPQKKRCLEYTSEWDCRAYGHIIEVDGAALAVDCGCAGRRLNGMDRIKIENFRRAHPGARFPRFEPLAPERVATIRRAVATSVGLPPDANPLEVVRVLHKQSGEDVGSVPDSGRFDIRTLLSKAGVSVGDHVYLDWYRLDDVDEMVLDDLSNYFDEIWYPSADDLNLFDDTLGWFLSITHDGRAILRLCADSPQRPTSCRQS